MTENDHGRAGKLNVIALVGCALAVLVALFWYGTIHIHTRIGEALAYDRARLCPGISQAMAPAGPADQDCVDVVDAVVQDRHSLELEFGNLYDLVLSAPGRRDRVSVSRELYDSVRAGSQVRLYRFHDKAVAVHYGEVNSTTSGRPGPPLLAGFTGTLFWGFLFTLTRFLPAKSRKPEGHDGALIFAAFVAAMGILVTGSISTLFSLGEFEPRLIYVSLALTPCVVLVQLLRDVLRYGWGKIRPQGGVFEVS